MVEKKIKKVKRSVEELQAPEDRRPTAAKVVEMEDIKEEARPRADDYDVLKKRYTDLKKRYEELETAFNRIGTLEEDIKKVHQKLDNIDANSANVEKDLAAVKTRVASVSKDMKAITVVAKNISQKYGFDIKVENPPEKRPASAQQKPATPPKQPAPAQGQQRTPVFTRAAKALAFARGAERAKQGSEEITAQPQKGRALEPRDHKDAKDRMDDVVVSGDDDMDTVDYLVRPDGKKIPLEKKKVEKELKELKDED
jgi:hypothetical protein